MMQPLDVHPADDAERIAAFRNVHDVWGRGLSIEEHLRRRLSSVQHNRAQWFVGTRNGDVLTSLGVYPLKFCYRRTILPGFAIGAVHTRSDCRGQGLAPTLIRDVERQVRAETGAAISLLYSDIDPGYYARMGYVECPAWEADFDPCDAAFNSAANEINEIARLSPQQAAGMMPEMYRAFHAERLMSIHRDAGYWEFLCRKSPNDDVYVFGPAGDPHGYVWLRVDDGSVLIRDAIVRGSDFAHLLNAVVSVARQRRANRVTGWLPQLPETLRHFSQRRRTDEITMLKSLSDEVTIDHEVTAAADFFHEIDHV